jgi:hypothetical protein
MHIKLITIFIRMMALDVKGGRRLSVKIRTIIVKHHKAGLSTVKFNEILQRKHDFTTTQGIQTVAIDTVYLITDE